MLRLPNKRKGNKNDNLQEDDERREIAKLNSRKKKALGVVEKRLNKEYKKKEK